MTDHWQLGLAVLGAAIAIGQLWSVRRSVKADHDRRKMHATLEFYTRVMQETLPHRRSITARYGLSRIPDDEVLRLRESTSTNGTYQVDSGEPNYRELHDDLKQVLNSLERIAVGARCGIFDIATLDQIGRSVIRGSIRRFRGYIEETQKHAHTNFENLLWLDTKLGPPRPPEPNQVKRP